MTTLNYIFNESAQLPFLVYGTLRQGERNSPLLNGVITSIEVVEIPKMTMYSNGGFPYVIPSDGESDTIVAELVDVEDSMYSVVLQRLDWLEHFVRPFSPENHYDRVAVTVQTTNGPREAYIYIAGHEAEEYSRTSLAKMDSGNWLNLEERYAPAV